ncbi:MAG: ABC transporter permease subunit [Candidatus Marinimicrobia bacterium]|jgi:taurine transport system permease protein|nr:ABC transporter permease subunit [Candidatus Neomarinimicrobiota bacterium]
MAILLIYIIVFIIAFYAVHLVTKMMTDQKDYTSLKTVTFGDESAVSPNRPASIISVLAIFMIWGAFTGSKLMPFHAPGPFIGETSFTYTAMNAAGETDEAKVIVTVYDIQSGKTPPKMKIEPGPGFAKNDTANIVAWRSGLIKVQRNDIGSKEDGYKVIAIDGQEISPEAVVFIDDARIKMTKKGTLSYEPEKGWQMQPIWLPSPEAVWSRLIRVASEGYKTFSLAEHLGWSLLRVVVGFLAGALVGIPLGYAMGLSGWFRGWFDPIVEFMRPVPPLALIPLVIIWFGIGEEGKIILLFLASLWIMTISARAGVSGVKISKIHAAYSLGASKRQIMRLVIVPNSLPEIFTGARVSMGVCWGTVVAAELVAAQKGAGMMIINASKFQMTDLVIMGIVLIGVIGYSIDILMRIAENYLVPWKGK